MTPEPIILPFPPPLAPEWLTMVLASAKACATDLAPVNGLLGRDGEQRLSLDDFNFLLLARDAVLVLAAEVERLSTPHAGGTAQAQVAGATAPCAPEHDGAPPGSSTPGLSLPLGAITATLHSQAAPSQEKHMSDVPQSEQPTVPTQEPRTTISLDIPPAAERAAKWVAEQQLEAKVRPSDEELAEQMFRAYNAQGPNPGKTWDGRDVPPFAETGSQVQGKWVAAARMARAVLLSCVCALLLAPAVAHAADGATGSAWWMQLVMLIGGSGAILTMLVVLAHKGVGALRNWLQTTPKLDSLPDVRAAGLVAANFLDMAVAGLESVERPLVDGGAALTPAGRQQMAAAALGALKQAAQSGGLPLAQQILDLGDHWAYGQIAAAVARMNSTRDAQPAQIDAPSTAKDAAPRPVLSLPIALDSLFSALPIQTQAHLVTVAGALPPDQRVAYLEAQLVASRPMPVHASVNLTTTSSTPAPV